MLIARTAGTATAFVIALGSAVGTATAAPAPMPTPAVPGIVPAHQHVPAAPVRTPAAKPVNPAHAVPAVPANRQAAPVTPVANDPSLVSLEILPGVRYTASSKDGSAVISSPLGTVTHAGGQYQVADQAGNVVFGPAITQGTDPAHWPIAARPTAPTDVRLDPSKVALSLPGLTRPAYTQDEFNSALGVAATNFGLATGIGSMVGGAIGLVVGCPIGAVTLGLTGLVTGPLDPIVAGLGCIVGGGTLAGVGALLGSMIVGIPVGIASAIEMNNTLNAPKTEATS